MCRSPTEVSTELGPTTGRSGDSPVSDGASAGLAVNSALTWSGWLVTTMLSSREASWMRKTSPSLLRALKLKPSGRTPNCAVCASLERGGAGGRFHVPSESSIGPDGEGGGPSSSSKRGSAVAVSAIRYPRVPARGSARAAWIEDRLEDSLDHGRGGADVVAAQQGAAARLGDAAGEHDRLLERDARPRPATRPRRLRQREHQLGVAVDARVQQVGAARTQGRQLARERHGQHGIAAQRLEV